MQSIDEIIENIATATNTSVGYVRDMLGKTEQALRRKHAEGIPDCLRLQSNGILRGHRSNQEIHYDDFVLPSCAIEALSGSEQLSNPGSFEIFRSSKTVR